jgi:hypothetical protein
MKKTNQKSSTGLIQLLERNGYKPTGDSIKDIAQARKFMPAKFKGE